MSDWLQEKRSPTGGGGGRDQTDDGLSNLGIFIIILLIIGVLIVGFSLF